MPNFPASFTKNNDIPIIANDAFGRLIVKKYHDRYHRQVDTIVAHVRNDVWAVGARKIASSIDRKCTQCLRARKALAEQVMGDVPECKFDGINSAWSCANMDLFSPVEIRDEVIKRGPRTCKKV